MDTQSKAEKTPRWGVGKWCRLVVVCLFCGAVYARVGEKVASQVGVPVWLGVLGGAIGGVLLFGASELKWCRLVLLWTVLVYIYATVGWWVAAWRGVPAWLGLVCGGVFGLLVGAGGWLLYWYGGKLEEEFSVHKER
jgi:hypothetical protein